MHRCKDRKIGLLLLNSLHRKIKKEEEPIFDSSSFLMGMNLSTKRLISKNMQFGLRSQTNR